ncbi:hypothetical protein TRAPUB_9379 [Trametes pubescens]|uniref:Uncharacterized protein n=1 Tax=Trametes pubescens TaxID=154538 RepID=A0A1M2W2I1_TRAPU|nr:hypothetical protein TRAPUB_9379 [Trametes pubescens]
MSLKPIQGSDHSEWSFEGQLGRCQCGEAEQWANALLPFISRLIQLIVNEESRRLIQQPQVDPVCIISIASVTMVYMVYRWASNKVREDGVRFPAAGGRFPAATHEELDRALGSAANPENRDVDILGDGDANGPMPVGEEPDMNDEEPDMNDEEMDGYIEVSAMDDVAATVRMDTA